MSDRSPDPVVEEIRRRLEGLKSCNCPSTAQPVKWWCANCLLTACLTRLEAQEEQAEQLQHLVEKVVRALRTKGAVSGEQALIFADGMECELEAALSLAARPSGEETP